MGDQNFTHTFNIPRLSYLDDDFRFEGDALCGMGFRAVSRRAKRWLKRNPPPGGWRERAGVIEIEVGEANELGSRMREAGFQIADPYEQRFGPYDD